MNEIDDTLSPAKGIILGVVLGSVFWLVVALVAWRAL